MNLDDFAASMKRQECYQSLRLLDGAWSVIRVDGRGFSKLTERAFEKPYDVRFRDLMHEAGVALVDDFQGVCAYVQSDEISLVLPPDWALFDRRVEKIVSLTAALASATFSLGLGEVIQFDSRVWVGVDVDAVVNYMRWREADATRCALNTACYWALRDDGKSARQATSILSGATISQKNELLFERGQNFNDFPVWQKRGVLLHWETYQKEGYNPIKEETVLTERRRIAIDSEIPMKQAFGDRVREILLEVSKN